MYGSGAVSCSCSLLIRGPNLARCQAEAPLIALCRFSKPALGAYPANITHGTYFSSVVNAVTGYSIYLPPEYATSPDQRFNVIYFLTGQGFGSGATENSEVTNDQEL